MPMDLQFLITQMISIPLPEKMILLDSPTAGGELCETFGQYRLSR